jgi:hypothetical protein
VEVLPAPEEAPHVNELLYRALLEARLTSDDVADQLQVDPKTVRFWLDGRLPYPRHRWALARLLHKDEAEPWPQLRRDRGIPPEVTAIYPHRDLVPTGDWVGLLETAQRDAGVLADREFLLGTEPDPTGTLASLAASGVRCGRG